MTDETPKLAPESAAFLGPPVDARGVVRKYHFTVGPAESLAAFQEEWAFFTPAVMYLRGGFEDAYLIDYMYELQEEVRFCFHKFDRPLFDGLFTPTGDADWNYVLWALRREYWDGFVDFVCSISVADVDAKHVWRYGLQEVDVVDPVALSGRAVITAPPLLRVGAFGIYGSRNRLYFRRSPSPFGAPRLASSQPHHEDVVFAKAYFEGRNPISAKERYRDAVRDHDAVVEDET